MKKLSVFLCLSLALGVFLAPAQAAHEGLDIRILDAKRVFAEFNSMDTHRIPKDNVKRANAIIIFPDLIKAGFLYAGRYGLGICIARDEQTGAWSPPAFVRLSGGSFGLQMGAQWSELILVGRGSFHLEYFHGGPSVSGSASVSFGPWGVHSEIGTGWQLNSSMHWYSRNAGLFAALSTDGTVLSYDEEANNAYYGHGATAREVLFGRQIRPSVTGQMLIDELTAYESQATIPEDLSFAYAAKQDSYGNPPARSYSDSHSYNQSKQYTDTNAYSRPKDYTRSRSANRYSF